MKEKKITIEYNDKAVRYFMLASIIWAIVGLGAGVLIALQLRWWQINGGLYIDWQKDFGGLLAGLGWANISIPVAELGFGRLRPLHTNAAIFAFVGNMMFAGIYYSTQRLCKVRLASGFLTWLHFYSWQIVIVLAAATLPFGFTQGKEYAELIWPVDILVVISWLAFAGNFFWTLARRNEPSLYVSIWFYIGTIVTVAMLYVVNNLQLPTSLTHSYSIYTGVQDAIVQWWYGHNAVAFFLTTPILGIMYYFVPKAANRPVYSYRLSVIHFWSLVFIYIWAGPHHLLHTALPEWLQSVGMLFSLMLWAPSWGGMLNGLLTLRSGWQELIKDPVIKFFAAGVTFYGMSTFEGPLMAIKSVNALSHYTDWTIGHVHSGTLGWNGFMAAGMFYWLAPRLWNTRLYSVPLANMHFWLGMMGILLYISAMWVSGISQGASLNATTAEGALKYQFLETVQNIMPAYLFRAIGGIAYLTGFFLLAYNMWKTIRSGKPHNGIVEFHAHEKSVGIGFKGTFLNAPTVFTFVIIVFSMAWVFGYFGNEILMIIGAIGTILAVLLAIVNFQLTGRKWIDWYDKLLKNSAAFTALTLIAAAIGGCIQIIPTLFVQRPENMEGRIQKLYTPLELCGRDIYIEEGCYNCHSQMIRTMVPEVLRYGKGDPTNYSHIGESIYDHPFQWGSKRTGPDLAREGSLRSNDWHYLHFIDPRQTSPGSNMPSYVFFKDQIADWATVSKRMEVLHTLGVPFAKDSDTIVHARMQAQAIQIIDDLAIKMFPHDINSGISLKDHMVTARENLDLDTRSKMVAIIAYIQSLGKYEMIGEKSLNEPKK